MTLYDEYAVPLYFILFFYLLCDVYVCFCGLNGYCQRMSVFLHISILSRYPHVCLNVRKKWL